MNPSLRLRIQSLGNVFSEGVAFDEELVTRVLPASSRNIMAGVIEKSTAWSVRPHVRPTDVSKVSSGMDTMSESRTVNSDAKAVFSRAIKQSMCSRVDLFYYSDFYMSRCVKELQDLYQFLDVPTVSENNDIQPHQTSTWWRHLVAGGLAGAVSRTSTAPLDRLKVFLMVYSSKSNNMKMSSAMQNMLKEGGITSLWRGNGMNVTKVMPEMALKFMAYEQIKSYMKGDSKKELNIYERFASGSLAGVMSQTAIYPLEVIKTRLVIRKTGQYKGIYDCVKNILETNGIKGFYRGYIPNVMGIIPYAGIDLAIYETLKRSYISHQSAEKQPGAEVLVACAVISSTCGQLVSYPLSLVRTRLQAHAVVIDGASESVTHILKTIVNTDGTRGLYRGLLANLLKVAPAVSISYLVYENTRILFGADMS